MGEPLSGTGSGTNEGYTLVGMIQRVRQVLRPGSNTHDLPSLGSQGHPLYDLRARVRASLRDDAGGFISDTEIDQWINEGLEQVAVRSRSVRHTLAGTVGPDNKIALPFDFIEALRLELAGKPVDIQTADEQWYDFADSTGGPRTVARVFGNKMELFP